MRWWEKDRLQLMMAKPNLRRTVGNHRPFNFRLSDIGKKWNEYLKKHNKICQYFYWNICREYGMDGLLKENLPRTVPANKPEIILRHNEEKWCNWGFPTGRKMMMRKVKTKTIPVIVGALGAMPHSIKGNLKKIMKNLKEGKTIQEIALCGTAHILRKIL